MKNIVVTGVLMLACGFAGGWWVKARQARHELAERTYNEFTALGFSSGVANERDLWRSELGDKLALALAEPWRDYSWDNIWGTAYMTMRDDGPRVWRYADGMPPGRQDEMVRYLCFLIERRAGFDFQEPRDEFGALVTYPQETITRNQDKVKRAVFKALSSYFDGSGVVASCYAVHLTDTDWGSDFCGQCLEHTARSGISAKSELPFMWMIDGLGQHVKGEHSLTDTVLGYEDSPTTQMQSGAAQVLARFVEQAWVKDIQNPNMLYRIESRRKLLATAASRPTTRPAN